MKRKILIIITALIVLVGGFWLYSWYKAQPVAHEFIGKINKIEGGVLFVTGVLTVEEHPELSGPDKMQDVEIVISSDVKYVKTLLYLPTAQELEKTNGAYRPSDLKKDIVDGNADDLIKLRDSGMGLSFVSDNNIYGKKRFAVQKVDYIEPVYPE